MIRNITTMNGRRVVVTGMGVATAFGDDLEYCWEQLISGKSAIRKIESFDASELGCQIAGEIRTGQNPGEIDIDKYMDHKEQKHYNRFIHWGIVAADQALKHSGLLKYFEQRRKDSLSETCKKEYDNTYDEMLESSGVIIGSGIGGIGLIEKSAIAMNEESKKNLKRNPLRDPYFIVGSLINTISGLVSMKYSLKGPNQSAVTACATGAHAIGDAARLVAIGEANIMIAGGAEGSICKLAVAGFDVMKALSRNNDNPEQASCPWSNERDGFVMGEGAGVLVLEEYNHALKRGAKIYGEIVGYGSSGDAYHISAPHPEGDGGMRAMKAALKNALLEISDISYINAHGTSTPLGDLIELRAIKKLFSNDLTALKNLSISSTKSSIGHLLGAAGAVEAIFSLMAIDKGQIPPTLNLHNPADFVEGIKVTEVFDLTPLVTKNREVRVVVSNSFGFGGTNASLIFKKI